MSDEDKDKDNPFGSTPSDNPFGSTPSDNPFGSTPSDNPFGSTPSDNPFGSTEDKAFGGWPRNQPGAPPPPPRKPTAPPPRESPPPPPREYAPPPGDPFAGATPARQPGDLHDSWRAPPPDPLHARPPSGTSPRAEGAIPALIFGIVGIVFCPLCAPFAWVLGRQAEQKVDASGGTLSGRGEATAGKILGIVSCVISILVIVLFVGLFAVGSSVSTSP